MYQRMKKVVALAALAAPLAVTAPAKADVIQLGFILDGSGSIQASEWLIIRQGLANAINSIPVGGTDTYEVSVVQFGTTATTYAQASNVLLTDSTVRSTLSTFINNLGQTQGFTNYDAAFTAMSGVLDNTANAFRTYVNFATDGEPNRCGNGSTSQTVDAAVACAGTSFSNMLTNASVDNVSVEGIGVSGGAATLLQNNFCYPLTCDTTSPYNFPNQGFYIGVANAQGYADAIGNKIAIITGVPEPATLALLGIGLAGLGFRRRQAA